MSMHPCQKVKVKVTQLCPTLWDLMDYRQSPWNSPGQNTGVGSLSLLQGDLPNPGIKHRSSALQAGSLPAEPQKKSENTGVGSLSLFQGIFPIQESDQGLLLCRWIIYQPSIRESIHAKLFTNVIHLILAVTLPEKLSDLDDLDEVQRG